MCASVKQKFPNSTLGAMSSTILRKNIEVSGLTRQVNDQLKHICDKSGHTFTENSIRDESGLNNSKSHVSAQGSALLATRFIKFINADKQFNKQAQGSRAYT